jgi:hypothetical protein
MKSHNIAFRDQKGAKRLATNLKSYYVFIYAEASEERKSSADPVAENII